MTKREIAALACRILSVYWIVSSVGSLPRYVYAWESSQIENIAWRSFVILSPLGFALMVALLLWFEADRLAARMIPAAGTSAAESQVASEDLQAIAFSVVGLWVLTRVIPSAIHFACYHFWFNAYRQEPLDAYTKAEILQYVVELAIGLGLLFRSHDLVRMLKRARGGKTRRIQTATGTRLRNHSPDT